MEHFVQNALSFAKTLAAFEVNNIALSSSPAFWYESSQCFVSSDSVAQPLRLFCSQKSLQLRIRRYASKLSVLKRPHPRPKLGHCSKALSNHHKQGRFPVALLSRALCVLPNGHSVNLLDVIEGRALGC